MKTKKEIQQLLKIVSPKIKKMYRIRIDSITYKRKDGYNINIHSPSFINIDCNDKLQVEDDGICISFRNSVICVNIWKDALIMHTTVYR